MELNLYVNESVLAVILFEKGQTSYIALKHKVNITMTKLIKSCKSYYAYTM